MPSLDNNGNLTSVTDGPLTTTYTWDRANRMMTQADGTDSHSYAYDGMGNRVQTIQPYQSGTDTIQYLLDMQPGLTKVIGSDTSRWVSGVSASLQDRYVHTPHGIHWQRHDVLPGPYGGGLSSSQYTLQDGLGSVRSWVSAGSTQMQMIQHYAPYGEPMTPMGAGFGFTGEQTDSNGLIYLRARYYDPSMGVFTTLDPFEGMPGRPMSLNGYSWVMGNTPNSTDPSGLFDWNTLTTEPGDCLYCIGRELGIISEPYDNQAIRNWIDGMIAANPADAFITNAADCPPGATNCPSASNPWLKPGVQLTIVNGLRIPDAQNNRYGRYCYNNTCNQEAATPTPTFTPSPTVTPSPTTTPSPTGTMSPTPSPTSTCTPTFTPSPSATPTIVTDGSSTRYFTVGPRYDISAGALSGVDVNAELHCTLTGGGFMGLPRVRCGWFANVSVEFSPSASANTNLGLLFGSVSFPNPGDTAFTYAAGLGATVLEGDVTVSESGEFVVFIGVGRSLGASLPVSPYGTVGGSVYLGTDIFNVSDVAWARLIEVVEFISGEAVRLNPIIGASGEVE